MRDHIRACLLCGTTQIRTAFAGRFVFVRCGACGADIHIEFDPPDEPHLRGRIVHVETVTDDDSHRTNP